MRADRLLSILMLLQTRGQMTAQQLSEEVEVSVRTIYRDLDALSAAGVPVYAERGPGGGCALLDSYRTTLTGLTQDEVHALFMLSIPAPLAELGVDQELRAALLKLAAALPDARRHDEVRARQRIHLDSEGWFETKEPVPHLQTIQQALWQDHRLHITYRLPREAQAGWLIEPYGLVAKGNTWHLVCVRDGHMRVYRVSRVLDAAVMPETFERPASFNLAAFWRDWCAQVEENRPHYPVTVRVPDRSGWTARCGGLDRAHPVIRNAGRRPRAHPWLRARHGSGVAAGAAQHRLGLRHPDRLPVHMLTSPPLPRARRPTPPGARRTPCSSQRQAPSTPPGARRTKFGASVPIHSPPVASRRRPPPRTCRQAKRPPCHSSGDLLISALGGPRWFRRADTPR
ncbi:MAG: WYL domain-containing protein [Anaerolineae bacterium]